MAGAFDTVRQMLDQFGLGSLADWAWGRFQEGASLDQIAVEVYQRPEFQAVYPEYAALAAKGRAYSVGELQAYRKAVVGIFQSYGIPPQFYDQPEDLARLAASEISVAEISKRVSAAAEAVYRQPPEVRAEMERLYGVSDGDLFAFWLDPNTAEPILTQKYVGAQIGASARTSGFGTLTADEASRLAQQGVDQQMAQKGFGDLTKNRELFGAIDQGETNLGRDVQLGAEFGGDAAAQQAIEQRRSKRLAEFGGGGGYAVGREGVAGLG